MENGNSGFGGREVVIVEAVRTPIGRGHPEKGYYRDTHPSTLLARNLEALIERAGIDPLEVGDVIGGCVQQFGEQTFNITRNAWLQAGLPEEVPATTVDRQCGSGQQAVNLGAALIASGVHDVVVGCGVEHMGHNSFATGAKVMEEYGGAVHAGAARALRTDPAGPLGGDDRRQMGDPALRARRARPALPAARPAGDRGGPLRARDDALPGQRRHLPHRPGPARDDARGPRPAQAGLQGGRQDHRRQLLPGLRRRRRGAADGAREGRGAGAHPAGADLRPDHGRSRPGDHADRPDPGDRRSCWSATR